MNAIYVLWLRQIKKYLRSRARIIGSLAQPVLYMVAFGYGFGSIFTSAGMGDYTQFLVPGIIAMTILFTSMFIGIDVIWDRQFGFLKETMVAPVSRTKIFLGRTLGGATIAFLQGVIILFVSVLFGFDLPGVASILTSFVFMFLIAFLFTAFGTGVASLLEDMQGFPLIMNFLMMPLFFLSGALFPIDGFPQALKYLAFSNPLTYGVDGVRGAMVGSYQYGIYNDLVILLGFALVATVLGSYLFKKIKV